MAERPKPRIVVSKCIEFDSCRWNGLKISSGAVKLLKPFVEFIPVCPEMELGLGVPREPIRIVRREGERRLIQSETERDLTGAMLEFTDSFISSVGKVDGFILKEKSPSCGVKNVKVYPRMGKSAPIDSRNPGFFGKAVRDGFPGIPLEDEGRLNNFSLREHFLTSVFALARLRSAIGKKRMKDLVDFHTRHKLLLMAYSQKEMRALGKLVANREKKQVGEVLEDYRKRFPAALKTPPGPGPVENVFLHALGYFKDRVSPREKEFFLESIRGYRARRRPMGVPVAIIRSWIVRFDEPYLARQAFFDPYPSDLIEVTDSGKGREVWR